MLTNIWILSLGTLIAVILYWSIPANRAGVRQRLLTVLSAFLVLMYSIGGFFACFYLVLVPLAAQFVFRTGRTPWILWLFIALSLLPMVGTRLIGEHSFYLTFGIAFATVKSLGLVLTVYSGRVSVRPQVATLMIFFFPLFTVGPVERLATFEKDNFAVPFAPKTFLYGLYRIGVGLFVVMFICAELLEPLRNQWFGRSYDEINAFAQSQAFGLIVVSFLYTYLNFEGFSAIAIGLSRLFGLKVIENFDRPLMITNIAEFWKRYHISMGNWINQFIFFPLVVWIKKPWASYISTVIAFVLFGMWHAFSLNYLVWGLGNGIGVALMHYGATNKMLPLVKKNGPQKWAVGVFGGAVTLTFIAWIQTFANLESFETGVLLTMKLLAMS